jgi:hypothetical protein
MSITHEHRCGNVEEPHDGEIHAEHFADVMTHIGERALRICRCDVMRHVLAAIIAIDPALAAVGAAPRRN